MAKFTQIFIISTLLILNSTGLKSSSESKSEEKVDSWELDFNLGDFKNTEDKKSNEHNHDHEHKHDEHAEHAEHAEVVSEVAAKDDAVQTKGNLAQFNPIPGGGNTAVFNEACRINGKNCDTSYTNLICLQHENRCACDPQDSQVFVSDARKCQKISRDLNNWWCEYHEQCKASTMGLNSKCERNICICYDWFQLSSSAQDVIQVHDKCWLKKSINETCSTDEECEVTISGSAYCAHTSYVGGGWDQKSCQCSPGHFWEGWPHNECLQYIDHHPAQGSKCKSNSQCTYKMGKYSKCGHKVGSNEPYGECQCSDELNSTPMKTVFFKGACYLKKSLDDDCDTTIECQAGVHENAICIEQPSYRPGFKTCKCSPGKRCDTSGSNTNFISLKLHYVLFITIALTLLK